MSVRSTFAVLFLGVIPASVTLAEPVGQQNQANRLPTVEMLVRPRVSQPNMTPIAQNDMVCSSEVAPILEAGTPQSPAGGCA